MQRFQESFNLYIVSLPIAFAVLIGSSKSLYCASRSTLEGTKVFLVPRVMESGRNSEVTRKRHHTQKKMGKKSRRLKEDNSPTKKALTSQPRRRSGRLTKLYWKDLSGISSETDPIILDSGSSDAEEEEKISVDASCNEVIIKKNKEVAMERDFSAYGKGKEGIKGFLKGAEVIGRRKIN